MKQPKRDLDQKEHEAEQNRIHAREFQRISHAPTESSLESGPHARDLLTSPRCAPRPNGPAPFPPVLDRHPLFCPPASLTVAQHRESVTEHRIILHLPWLGIPHGI